MVLISHTSGEASMAATAPNIKASIKKVRRLGVLVHRLQVWEEFEPGLWSETYNKTHASEPGAVTALGELLRKKWSSAVQLKADGGKLIIARAA
jgi:hypothetical protein